jgi:hypothetical protein
MFLFTLGSNTLILYNGEMAPSTAWTGEKRERGMTTTNKGLETHLRLEPQVFF